MKAPALRRGGRQSEHGTEDGCLFAFVLVWMLALIVVPLLAA